MDRPHVALSPHFGLFLARIYGPEIGEWPTVILRSAITSWVFDPAGTLSGPEATITAAIALGLHEVTDPFGPIPAATDPEWKVTLPTLDGQPGRLHGPGGLVVEPLTSRGAMHPGWIDLIDPLDRRCRLLIAAGVTFLVGDGTEAVVDTLNTAAAARRIAGATIPVEI